MVAIPVSDSYATQGAAWMRLHARPLRFYFYFYLIFYFFIIYIYLYKIQYGRDAGAFVD